MVVMVIADAMRVVVGMVVVIMVVRMLVVVVVVVLVGGAKTAAEEGDPDREDGGAADQTENRVQPLRHDEPRSEERYEAEREHAEGVGDRDGKAENHGVSGRAAAADQVGGDHRFAMAG